MQIITHLTIFFYVAGTGAYFTYLFFQKNSLEKLGFGLLGAGFLLHSAGLGFVFSQTGSIPAHNLNETLLIAAWASAGVFLWVRYRYRLKILGVYAAPLAAFIMTMASQFSRGPVKTQTIFKSFWLYFHILGVFIGEAFFALACGLGILYLIHENTIKSKTRGFFYKRLPPLELLDITGYSCITIGFVLLTLGLIAGFVYAQSVWGRFWSWDPKEIWSTITWGIYAGLLHQRLTVGWRGKRSAIMAILGFAVVLFTFFGVNFLFKGHHQEFTRW
jgi:cytochrome c-type biogenesis protein CcsB